jgi:hypothetical protein
MGAVSGASKREARQQLANQLRQERQAGFAKTRAQMGKVNDPKLKQELDEYKASKSSNQQDKVIVPGKPEVIDKTPQKIISGEDLKIKQQKWRELMDEKERLKREKK